MNELGQNVLNIMENSMLGRMSVHVLKKQTEDAGLDLDDITATDIPKLVERLKTVLPFFIGNDAQLVLIRINRLGNGGIQNIGV